MATLNNKTLRNLRFLANALLLVIALGTAGFHYVEGWLWFDRFCEKASNRPADLQGNNLRTLSLDES